MILVTCVGLSWSHSAASAQSTLNSAIVSYRIRTAHLFTWKLYLRTQIRCALFPGKSVHAQITPVYIFFVQSSVVVYVTLHDALSCNDACI